MKQAVPYHSPFALLNLPSEGNLDAASLKKARKRLLTEFELQDSPEIELAGQTFDKSALMSLLDQMEDEHSREMHRYIHQHASLRSFLEKGELSYFHPGKAEDTDRREQKEDDFRAFLAPYFAFRYNHELAKAFKNKDWDRVEVLCVDRPLPVEPEVYPYCYHDTARDLQLRVEGLQELAKRMEQGESPGLEVQEVCDEWLITGLNLLSPYFEGLRNAYAIGLEELAMAVNNDHGRSGLAKFIIRQGLKLELNQETRHRLLHILDQLLEMEPDGSFGDFQESTIQGFQKTFKGVKGWQLALGAFVGVQLIILLVKAIL